MYIDVHMDGIDHLDCIISDRSILDCHPFVIEKKINIDFPLLLLFLGIDNHSFVVLQAQLCFDCTDPDPLNFHQDKQCSTKGMYGSSAELLVTFIFTETRDAIILNLSYRA